MVLRQHWLSQYPSFIGKNSQLSSPSLPSAEPALAHGLNDAADGRYPRLFQIHPLGLCRQSPDFDRGISPAAIECVPIRTLLPL